MKKKYSTKDWYGNDMKRENSYSEDFTVIYNDTSDTSSCIVFKDNKKIAFEYSYYIENSNEIKKISRFECQYDRDGNEECIISSIIEYYPKTGKHNIPYLERVGC